jgi:Helicase conserved C-terminal domain
VPDGTEVGVVTAAWLRRLGQDGLAELLRRRPEALAAPAPVSLGELAERLATPGATVAALRRLARPTLQVAEALAALGGRAERPALDRLLGAGTAAARADVTGALDVLLANALLLDDAVPHLVPAAGAFWPRALGLGEPVATVLARRTAADLRNMARNLGVKPAARKADILDQVVDLLRDGERVRAVVAGAPADVRDLLDKAAAGAEIEPDRLFYGSYGGRPATPQAWAIARGLLARTAEWDGDLVMPAEVALVLRGSKYTAPFDSATPPVARSAADPMTTARAVAAAGAAMVRLTADLLDAAGKRPIPTLRTGGMGMRELSRMAKGLGCAEPDLRLAVSVAVRAGLLSLADGQATPTAGYDSWRECEPASQLSALLTAWWRSPSAPLATAGAITPDESDAGTTALRAAVIAAASEPAATAIDDPRMLADLVMWRRPLAFGDSVTVPDRAVACWREATLLGIIGAGAVTEAARALLDGADDLTALLADIGTTQHTAQIQADLTAVVAGSPDAHLAALLDLAAEPESRGVARTWRFSPATVRRALDAGHTAESLLEELTAVTVAELPQPLRYLIADVARRHGSVRATAVACCLRSDDTALLTEIVADRRLRTLGLRQLAPTVLAAAVPLSDVLSALRNAGYAPVTEADDGTPILERAINHRASTRSPRASGTKGSAKSGAPKPSPAATRPDAADLARMLLAAPDETLIPTSPTLEAVRMSATNLTTTEARILAHAIDSHQPVTISYVNRDGNNSRRTIENIEVTGGSLLAWCQLREDQRWFNLKRIVAIEPR